jgi:hypothetical protein
MVDRPMERGRSEQVTADNRSGVRPAPRGRWGVLSFVLLALSIFLLLQLPAGCSSGPAWLTFRSAHAERQYSQRFSRAYFTRTADGEYDVVLVEDGIVPSTPAKRAGPITASAMAPLSQMVHLRVLWRPLKGVKPDHPSATNAVIDWYVRSNDSGDTEGDYLHYRGAGFVTVDESHDRAGFAIRSARVELSDSSGRMQDPLGESVLTGSFVATRNAGLVGSTLASIRSEDAPAQQPSQASMHEGPPARAPAGP